MPNAHAFGELNKEYGVCGFTSTLYALYATRPSLRSHIQSAQEHAETRLMAEIKTFLVMMKAQGKQSILDDIQTLTTSFNGYQAWTIDNFITAINRTARAKGVTSPRTNLSIAMPPSALVEYLNTCWDFNARVETSLTAEARNCILGLTRTGGPRNRFKNLAHYVYVKPSGQIQSWGSNFTSLADVNKKTNRNYSLIYRVSLG